MSGKLVCITCGTRTNSHNCYRCGEQKRFSDKVAWVDIEGPLANIDYLAAMGFHAHFSSEDKLKDRIHPWNLPHIMPWFSRANQHLWFTKAQGHWYIGTFKDGFLHNVYRNTELFTLLNEYNAQERDLTRESTSVPVGR
jgi:hypothetical protein